MKHFPTPRRPVGPVRLPWLTLLSLLALGCAKGAAIDPNEIVILSALPPDQVDAGGDAAADADAPISSTKLVPPETPSAGTGAAVAPSAPSAAAPNPPAAPTAATLPSPEAASNDAGATSSNDAGAGARSDAGG